jgi:hypothetical protein
MSTMTGIQNWMSRRMRFTFVSLLYRGVAVMTHSDTYTMANPCRAGNG